MAYYINPDAILDNSIKTSSLPKKVQKKVDLYEVNKQKPLLRIKRIKVQDFQEV